MEFTVVPSVNLDVAKSKNSYAVARFSCVALVSVVAVFLEHQSLVKVFEKLLRPYFWLKL